MDEHLNLFFGYSQGKLDNDSEPILENNVTRAFIITLSKSYKLRKLVFKLIEEKLKVNNMFSDFADEDKSEKNYYYDLQNFKADDFLNNKLLYQWVILKLSPVEAPNNNIYDNLKKYYDAINDDNFNKNKIQYLKELNDIIFNEEQKEDEFRDNQYIDELNVCKDFIERNGLPDAWILDKSKNVGICIESKIYGYCTRNQIERHKKYIKNNVQNIGTNNIKEVEITWETINKLIDAISTNNLIEKYLLTNLKEYLKMANLIPDLSFIVEKGKGYEKNEARKQFKLFLLKLDSKVAEIKGVNLGRGEKPLDKIWDYYGCKEKGSKPRKNPHYSIGMGDGHASVYLTTNNGEHIKRLLKNNNFKNYIRKILEPKNVNYRPRYYMDLIDYKLIDYKKGMQKGETFTAFNFTINFSELNEGKKNIDTILDAMEKFLPFSKQFDFGIRIDYPNISKIKRDSNQFQLRLKNEELFKDYNLLIDLYIEFMNDTMDIFSDISKVKS